MTRHDMSTPKRYERLRALFEATCALDPQQQEEVLDRECADDSTLRQEVEALLAKDSDPTSFLENPALGEDFSLAAGIRQLGSDISLQAGDELGAYRIIRRLSQGGQGVVYLAQDTRLGRQVALKVLTRGFGGDEHHIRRFKREAEAAARLDHPGICTVHDVVVDGAAPYIAMRYVEGETLAAKIASAAGKAGDRKTISLSSTLPAKSERTPGNGEAGASTGTRRRADLTRLVHFMERAARAVHVAHEAGVIHRDIKPGNIMVTPEGDPVVLDFGLARDEQSVTVTLSGDVFGTPAYMAPEQILSTSQADRRTDVYSLGAALYECLTLRRPFEAPTREGLYRAIVDRDPVNPRSLNPAISHDLKVVLETALAKEPQRRYRTALDLAEDLRRVRELKPIAARPAGPLVRVHRWARRNPAVALTVAGIFLTLSAGLVVPLALLGKTRASLAETRGITDIRTLADLQRIANDELWPLLPQTVPELDRWLGDAEALYGRLGLYRDDLEKLRRSAVSGAEEQWVFADPQTRRRHDLVAGFVDDLSRFEETIEEVRARRANASTIAGRTIGVYRDAWSSTIEAIADEARNPQYQGLRIEPQSGLVPIGQDPDSRLFEFTHLQTGQVPVRDPKTGKLVLTEETGLVFVLIPGGSFYMGADLPPDGVILRIHADAPDFLTEARPVGSPSIDPYAGNLAERPAHRVELDAFFLAKYEMTQGQWLRATGENPSHWSPGSDAHAPVTLLHPVENVSWDQCVRTLQRFGLGLPTEAQWEYAARAGTNTIWWTGNRKESLRGAINVADQAAARAGADWPEIAEWPDLDDGYVEHAPVGTFLANPFGLHEVHGNVWELVRDRYGLYLHAVRAGDGERLVAESGVRVVRGGGFYEGVSAARMAARYQTEGDPTWSRGLRPARTISTGGASPMESTR